MPSPPPANPPVVGDIVTEIPAGARLSSAVGPASPSARLLKEMGLDPSTLNRWTHKNWEMLYASSSLDFLITNSRLYTALQDLRPQGFDSQEFVQDSNNCTPPYCQISWAGIAFNNADMALMAFDLLDKEIRPTELINQINLAWDQTLIEKLKAIP